MTNDCLVSIQGLQFGEGVSDEELDQIETICPGKYFHKADAQYILYDEIIEGMGETIQNKIKIKSDEITVTKKGPFQVQMIFEKGKKTMTEYHTPFGSIMLAMDTQVLEVTENEEKIQIYIKYGLEANYQFVADCEIRMDITEKLISGAMQ